MKFALLAEEVELIRKLGEKSNENSKKEDENGRKSSLTSQPAAFSNQMFSLTDLT